MESWALEYRDWNPQMHPKRESLCTLGNGYFTTRGALEENKAGEYDYPGTYLAGGYNRADSKIKGRNIENEDLVNWPNWLPLTFRIGKSDWMDLYSSEVLEYELSLKLKEGMLERKMRFRDKENHITILISRRIVSMHDPHVAAIEWTLIPENWSGDISIRTGIDGNVANKGVKRYNDLNGNHLNILETGDFNENSIYLISQTKQSKTVMTQAAVTRIFQNENELYSERTTVKKNNEISQLIHVNCTTLQPLRIEKLVSIYTSKDFAISDPQSEVIDKTNQLNSFKEILQKHTNAWAQIWNRNDFDIVTNSNEVNILRLHIFHVHQTISQHSVGYDIGIPSRGWHGEAYRGHVFWDELYILPYINLHSPQLARSLLMYRYRRLPKARQLAKKNGYKGAMFPWQSGSNGREESQEIHLNPKSGRWLPDYSSLQRHINSAIAYNVWQYYQTTGDMDFLSRYGAEIILNIALFWSGIATYNPKHDRYEIRGVMGPDEYHTSYPDSDEPGLNNNAYTNFMAVWVCQCALDLLKIIDSGKLEDLSQELDITIDDKIKWQKLTTKMYIPINEDGIILQFEGFENLRELDWDKYHTKYGNVLRLDRILETENDSPNNYRACKQADSLMLFYLFSSDKLIHILDQLGYKFLPEFIPLNIEYYRKVTAHGSTLSQVIFSWVDARSDRELSWKSFLETLKSDVEDVQGGTTSEGIHLGAMAGTIDIIQRCYTGLEIRDNILWLNPKLPNEIKELNMQIRYSGSWIKLHINQKKLIITIDQGWLQNPVEINVNGISKIFKKNDSAEFELV